MDLRKRIRDFLKREGMPPSRFGREAAGDPRLLKDLANGRELGPRLAARIRAYLDAAEGRQA